MAQERSLTFGTGIYDESGTKLGHIRGFDEEGFYVSLREGIEGLSVEHVRSSPEVGEAELTWRCMTCGEMDDLEDELPEACPNCDSPREDLYYYVED